VEQDLEGLTSADLATLLAGLGSEGAVLVLCGDLDEPLARRLQQDLAGLAQWATRLPGASSGPAAADGDDLALLEQPTEQLVLMLGAATVPLAHPDALPLRLLQAHLGLGMSSRLFVVMREERGLAYDVGVHMPARCGATPFIWHLSTSAERAAEATDCLQQEWQRLLEEPLNEGELALAKARFRGQDALGRQTCGQVADRQALLLGYGLGEDHVQACLERAARLDGQALLSAAQRWLTAPKLSLCGPGAALKAAERSWTNRRSG
jgi:predicted Zn-dependent peptidase